MQPIPSFCDDNSCMGRLAIFKVLRISIKSIKSVPKMHVKNIKSKTGTRSSPRSTYSTVELRGMMQKLLRERVQSATRRKCHTGLNAGEKVTIGYNSTPLYRISFFFQNGYHPLLVTSETN